MTSLAKDLAQDLNLHFNEKAVQVENSQNSVRLFTDSGSVFKAKKVVFTCPLPQSLEILNSSFISYPENLDTVSYSPALAGLFELNGPVGLFDFNLLRPHSNLFTIANNQAKGISKKLALSVVMSETWSLEHFKLDDADILQLIQNELQQYFKADLVIHKSQLKKWRYSQPTSVYHEKYVLLCGGQILLAGDAFGGASIAGAIRSANAVFDHLIESKF